MSRGLGLEASLASWIDVKWYFWGKRIIQVLQRVSGWRCTGEVGLASTLGGCDRNLLSIAIAP